MEPVRSVLVAELLPGSYPAVDRAFGHQKGDRKKKMCRELSFETEKRKGPGKVVA